VLESFRNIFAIPDLRKRLFFTFALLGVYRIGCIIPSPGVDPHALLEFMKMAESGILGFVNTFTGGSLRRLAVFALGIMPYITSSIILQLLTVVWPYLEKLSKEGEMGRKKITQWTRYGTVVISVIQSAGIALFLERTTTPGGARWSQSGLGLPPDDHPHADHRLRVRHVAGRADQRARRRQRHLADHLRRHRGRASARHRNDDQRHVDRQHLDPEARCPGRLHGLVVAFIVYMERAQRRIPCSTRSASWAARSTAARAPTCRCASTPAA
jgi:preprotein translocase subunit SecY